MKNILRKIGLSLFFILMMPSLTEATPLHKSLNKPGEVIDLKAHLIPGKINIVHIYADWCPSCRNWAEPLKNLTDHFKDMTVLYVDIKDFDSLTSAQFDLSYIPYFIIYDGKGKHVAQDKEGDTWLKKEVERRLKVSPNPKIVLP